MTDMNKLLGPMARRLGNMVARGKVLAANSLGKLQILQLGLLAGETKDRVEHLEPFGFTAKPLPGAEHVTLFLDGDRSHGVTVVVAYLLVGRALRQLSASTAITLGLAEPTTAALLGVLVLGESLSPLQLVGAAGVLAGVVVAGTGPSGQPPEAPL